MNRFLLLSVFVLLTFSVRAIDINQKSALFNYQMFCQGCHTADGIGGESVPRLKGNIGRFLTITEGREFLVRVPGSANSSLNNTDLAEVLNWMVLKFGGESIPCDWVLYTAEEVGRLRINPLNEVEQYRVKLIAKISAIISSVNSVKVVD